MLFVRKKLRLFKYHEKELIKISLRRLISLVSENSAWSTDQRIDLKKINRIIGWTGWGIKY
jgi:hypothetical protein